MLAGSKYEGFTIVELLIVIVVIGILASITIIGYNSIQDRARASAISTGFRQIDKSFRLFTTDQNRTTWWRDASVQLTGAANPLIADIITNTNLKQYLQRAPEVSGLPTAYWWYDNDGDVYDPAGCTATTALTNGVNIVFTNVTQSVAQHVDNALDDGSLLCGKVRFDSGNRIFYSLGNDEIL